jgi:hypothetical protein
MTLEQQIEHGINDWAIETRAGQCRYFGPNRWTMLSLLAELIKTGVGH